MIHTESSLFIYFSSDYGRFKMIDGNRQLDELKIKKIIRAITAGNNMLRYYPIQVREVNGRLEILDGQHRFYICKKLKCPVFYVLVREEKNMADIAVVNSNVAGWKAVDYVNCYVQLGNPHYKQLQEFSDRYGFSNSVNLNMLYSGSPGSEMAYRNLTDDFKSGRFQCNHLDAATKSADACEKFKVFSGWRQRAFVIAVYRIMKADLVPIDEIVAAVNKRPELLTEQANYKAYVNLLEQIYNYGKQKRTVII